MNKETIFREFAKMMGLDAVIDRKLPDGNTVVCFEGEGGYDSKFSCRGYEEFETGGIFTPDGNLVIGYMDSHVAFSSGRHIEICKIIKSLQTTKGE